MKNWYSLYEYQKMCRAEFVAQMVVLFVLTFIGAFFSLQFMRLGHGIISIVPTILFIHFGLSKDSPRDQKGDVHV